MSFDSLKKVVVAPFKWIKKAFNWIIESIKALRKPTQTKLVVAQIQPVQIDKATQTDKAVQTDKATQTDELQTNIFSREEPAPTPVVQQQIELPLQRPSVPPPGSSGYVDPNNTARPCYSSYVDPKSTARPCYSGYIPPLANTASKVVPAAAAKIGAAAGAAAGASSCGPSGAIVLSEGGRIIGGAVGEAAVQGARSSFA